VILLTFKLTNVALTNVKMRVTTLEKAD